MEIFSSKITTTIMHMLKKEELPAISHIGVVRYEWKKSLWFTSMLLVSLIGGYYTFSISAFTLFVISTLLVLLLGHSLGSHRYLIHSSYQCHKYLGYFLVWCGTQVGLCGPIGLLRQHNLRDYAQRQTECHDYLRHGSSIIKDAYWQLHCDLYFPHSAHFGSMWPMVNAVAPDPEVSEDKFYNWLEKTWRLQQIPLALVLFIWGGWAFVVWGVCARITACVLGHWLIGYFAHNEGEDKRYNIVEKNFYITGAAVQGQNIRSKWIALLTMGESWHNNHHAYPGSAKLGLFKGEIDPGWWLLRLGEKLGFIWDIRLPHNLAYRPELKKLRVD